MTNEYALLKGKSTDQVYYSRLCNMDEHVDIPFHNSDQDPT